MTDIVNLRGETVKTPVYYDYEITLKDGTEPLRDYGFLIANGAFWAIGRGPNGAVELMTAVPWDDVKYIKSVGVHEERTNTLN